MRLIAGFKKGEEARCLSHLDFQRALQRLLRRAGLPLLYSSGFNPHPLISYASALPVGATGDCEAVELQTEDISEAEAFALLSAVETPGLACVRVRAVGPDFPSLTPLTQAAKWEISLVLDETANGGVYGGRQHAAPTAGEDEECGRQHAPTAEKIAEMLSKPIIVQKKGKAGIKPLDVTPLIYEHAVYESDTGVLISLIGAHTPTGSLPVALLAKALLEGIDISGYPLIHRKALLTCPRNGDGWVNIMEY